MRATRRTLAALLLAGLLPGGCGLVPTGRRSQPPVFSFAYTPDSGDGYMNQLLQITHSGSRSVAPVLKLYAVDSSGVPLPEVTVTGVFGSDRGELVVPAGYGVVDVMQLTGEHVNRVADVRASVLRAPVVEYPTITTEPVVTPLDSTGVAVTRNDVFTRIRVSSDNDAPITVRLIYITWNVPPEGQTQQAERTEPVGDLVTVPAHGQTDVKIAADDVAVIRRTSGTAPTSIKAYFSK